VALVTEPSPFILVHSPLVGPMTWSWVATDLERRGHRVVVPSLKEAAIACWERCVEEVVREVPSEAGVLVAHSGAGPLLPVIADRLSPPPRRLVFVDATVPPASGTSSLAPEEFLDDIRGLAQEGILPRWSEWFGVGAMEGLVPDDSTRATLVADMPQLPVSYFDGKVPMPQRWANVEGAYVLLSEPYRQDAARAATFGWPVRELLGGHLDIVTRAREVSDVLVELAR
jgi:hypothetical protein